LCGDKWPDIDESNHGAIATLSATTGFFFTTKSTKDTKDSVDESTHGAIATLSATTGSSFFFTTKSTKDTKGVSEDISLHAVFEFGDITVEHESCLNARKLHVGEDLGFVDRVNFLNTFQLDDQSALDQ